MKALPLLMLLVLPIALRGAEVGIGDKMEQVRAALGVPRGQLSAGDQVLLYFDRGEVTLRSGIVTRVSLLSEAEVAVRDARRVAVDARIRDEQATQTAAGAEVKARQLASVSFRNAPVSFQVAYWEDFSRRYPGVSCAEELAIARASLREQLDARQAQAEQALRVAELEERVAAAEATASRVGYYRYPNRSPYRGYRDAAPTLWPIEYRFYESPVLATSSPGMPPIEPKYRDEPRVRTNADCDWSDRLQREHFRRRDQATGHDSRRTGAHWRF